MESTLVVDRRGTPLYGALSGDGTRSIRITPEAIPELAAAAAVAAEDRRVWSHAGIDPLAIARAARRNLSERAIVEGGSTITQQVAKLLLSRASPGRRRGWSAKLNEAVVALRLEHRFSKREILAMYLNLAPYGNQIRGVERAAQAYFGRPASTLTAAEAAYLAALPQQPSRFNPWKDASARTGGSAGASAGPGPSAGPGLSAAAAESATRQAPLTRFERRRHHILDRMRVLDRLSAADYRVARAERVLLQREQPHSLAPHFVERVLGALDPAAPRPERVVSTLDATLQRHVRGIIDARREDLRRRHQAHNIAVVVLDNRTGEWLAWEGSGNYFDADHGGAIDGVLAPRQPGSALKPFAYAAAFERGYHPARVLADVPSQFPTAEPGILYAPRNYDDQFRGPLLARAALAGSENVPAVALAHDIGVPVVMRVLREAGFSTLDSNAAHYGLGITLGNAEVRLADLVSAYAMLARGGVTVSPTTIVPGPGASGVSTGPTVALATAGGGRGASGPGSPAGARGPVREERRLLSARTAFWIADILADDEARAFVFGRGGSLEFPFTVAAKTGTSQAYHDNWAVGFTREVTVGVWVGNFDRKPLVGSSGVTGAGPIFHDVMLAAVERVRGALPIGDRTPVLAPTPDVVQRPVCAVSGLTPGAACLRRVTEWLPAGAHIGDCTWHRHSGGQVVTLLPEEYRAWASNNELPGLFTTPSGSGVRLSSGPSQTAAAGPAAGTRAGSELEIVSPLAGATFLRDPTLRAEFQTLALRARGARGSVEWRVDGAVVGTSGDGAGVRWPLTAGEHRVEARDATGRTAVVTIQVR
jgi:penicillin-binding protein 1C